MMVYIEANKCFNKFGNASNSQTNKEFGDFNVKCHIYISI